MSDISRNAADLPVVIIGATTAGVATTPVASDTAGNLLVKDALISGAQYRAQSVTTTAALALGGATALATRKVLMISPTNGNVYVGFDSSVTTASGTPVSSGQTLMLSVTSAVTVYVIALATTDCRMAEIG